MCNYLLTTFRCGHTRKEPVHPCRMLPVCEIIHHDLIELNEDLGETRAAIRMLNLHQTHLLGYHRCLGRLRQNYPSFFGHGSGNGSRTIDSLEQLEDYLQGEIDARGVVTERERVGTFCLDQCWEGVCVIGEEEQWRRGGFNRRYDRLA